jgi:indole-3-glycerol phosphate synthase
MRDTILDQILAHKRTEVAARQSAAPIAQLMVQARSAPAPRGFVVAIRASIAAGAAAVIAEIKKASPSRGVIRADFEPATIARNYSDAGATCLSVLTDSKFFEGHDQHLRDARAAAPLPALRKDFVVDRYQIAEARVLGADCILLIVAALKPDELRDFYNAARDLSLDVLIEVHDRAELERGLKLAPSMIGINNRNLKTFATTLATTYKLLPQIPDDVIVVTESGIHERAQVDAMRARGVNAFLVGEAFMRERDPGSALRRLFFD